MKYLYTYRNHRGHERRILLEVNDKSDIFDAFHRAGLDYEILTGIYETYQIY